MEERHPRLGLRGQPASVEELALERGEEALAHGVIKAIADAPERRTDVGLAAPGAEGQRRVLTPVVRMVHDAGGLPLGNGHLEGGQHELRPEVPGHRPADDAAAEDVEDDGEVEEAAAGGHVRDVGHPERVGPVGRELALDEVRSFRVAGLARRRLGSATPADAHDPVLAHEPGHALLANAEAFVLEVLVDAERAVGAVRRGV